MGRAVLCLFTAALPGSTTFIRTAVITPLLLVPRLLLFLAIVGFALRHRITLSKKGNAWDHQRFSAKKSVASIRVWLPETDFYPAECSVELPGAYRR